MRSTVNNINTVLLAAGITDKIVRGQDYIYFTGPEAGKWYSSSVGTPFITDETPQGWLEVYKALYTQMHEED
jgi:hypothetical protein